MTLTNIMLYDTILNAHIQAVSNKRNETKMHSFSLYADERFTVTLSGGGDLALSETTATAV